MKWLGLVLVGLSLTSCAMFGQSSGIQNRDKAYLKAQSIPPLRIPAGLNSDQFENHYPVPDRNYAESTKTPTLKPPGA